MIFFESKILKIYTILYSFYSTFLHSQIDREKALEDVSILLAEKLKPKTKPKG